MNGLGWLFALLGLAVGAWSLRRCATLAKDLKQLKRDQYYTETRVKRVPEEIREAVQPLRWQVANMVEGKPVARDSIVNGRLYVDISAEDSQRILEGDHGVSETIGVIDVRTPKDHAAKRLPGARLVPFEELDTRYRTDIPDTADKVLVYCAGGDRSRLACDFLARQGYTNVYNVREGLQGWRGRTEGEGEMTFIKMEPSKR
jgi:rhodanese-related sulfurtransferase